MWFGRIKPYAPARSAILSATVNPYTLIITISAILGRSPYPRSMNPFSIDGYDDHSGKTHRAEANGGRRSVGNMKDGLVRRPVNQLGHALRQVKKVPRCRSGATAGGDPPAPAVVASVDEKSKIGNP